MKDTYYTLQGHARAELKVKGSRFLAEALPVEDVGTADQEIAAIRKREYNATHHCTAYRIGIEGDIFRYNDDGEPSGTAGMPILRQIEARELVDTLVVVTRYFGGTKLGTGGLIRAYGDAASLALDAASIEECIIRHLLRLRFGYDDTSPAMHTIGRFDTIIRETRYSDVTEIIVGVRRTEVDRFIAAFVNALGGRGTATKLD
ncbi:MAG: IMPACT family protein [Rhodothermales bacterium]